MLDYALSGCSTASREDLLGASASSRPPNQNETKKAGKDAGAPCKVLRGAACKLATLLRATVTLVPFWLGSVLSAAEIPRIVEAWPGGPPAFVRIDALLDSAGEPDRTVLQDYQVEALETYLSQPEENGCVRLRSTLALNGGPHANVKDATRGAKLLLLGTVTAQAQGLNNSNPGTLLEITPDEVLKGKKKIAGGPYYVFFPVASFELKGKSFCATDPDYPLLPQNGDQVIIFFRDPISTPGSFLPLVDATDLIVVDQKEQLQLPRLFRSDPAVKGLSQSSLLSLLRSCVAQEHRP